ncbi:hypothetical protein ABEF95_010534 [Exophiala dermatitidis]
MSAPPVKKACDACHRRKVRCTGEQPCNNCGQSNLRCTYLAIPQKKGPKGSRAKVISEIRVTQQKSTTTQSRPRLERFATEPSPLDFNSPPTTPAHIRQPALLSQQTIEHCVDFFFTNMCTTAWILDRQALTELLSSRLSTDAHVYCLTASLCAFVMVQPGMNLAVGPGNCYKGEPPENRYGYANMLLEDIKRVRKSIDYISTPTLSSVQISFLLFGCYFTLEKQNVCWFHLREAATLAQMMGMHEESSYLIGDATENKYKRRAYWLLLVTERAYAMERHRPLTLHPTIELPEAEEGAGEEAIISGFLHLIKLFICIDDEFMALWNKAKTRCTAAWFSELQQQLSDALPVELETTENQAADIKITYHWLRMMVWQLSIANGCVSSSSPDASLTFLFPIQVARDIVRDVQTMTLDAMEVHGIGLIEKLFDVACTLTDVISCVPVPLEPEATDGTPLNLLSHFLTLISRLRGGASRYLPLLLAKVSETLPSLTPPSGPENITIKQGYAGASDNIPTPVHPNGLPFTMSREASGIIGIGQWGVVPVQTAPSQQQHVVHNGESLFAMYSPGTGTQGSDTSMTSSPIPTPPDCHVPSRPMQVHAQQPQLPVPRSVPVDMGPIQFENYPGL